MKSKRILLNLSIGIGSQLITIVLGIFIPRLIMLNYGSDANGLIASIVQIIAYLALLEAGVGAASLQALYKPIAQEDKSNINTILAATSNYYKKTGFYYFIGVLLLAVIYPFIVNSEMSKLSVAAIILLTGMGGAINYYFQGKYRVLLLAEGKSYIETSIVTIANILNSVIRIVLLLQGFNIVAVQSSYFILMILQIIVFQIYIKKHYKWLNLGVKPDFEAINQKNAVLVHELSYLVFKNTDVLVLTLFTNLKIVSIYVLYNMIFNIVDNIVQTVNGSVKFALGQSYHKGMEQFVKVYDAYELYFTGLVFFVLTVAYILILPFMKMYTAGINDINYIDVWLPIWFVISKLLINARTSVDNVIDIAGHFQSTKYRSILESTINLVCSLIFVYFFGIYGVLMGTVVALLYRSLDMIFYANRILLNRSPWRTLKIWFLNAVIFVVIVTINGSIDYQIQSYPVFFLSAVILSIFILPLYFIILSLAEREVFLYTLKSFKEYREKLKVKSDIKEINHSTG